MSGWGVPQSVGQLPLIARDVTVRTWMRREKLFS